MDYVTGQMGMAIGQKFVKQEFDESAKSSVSHCFFFLFDVCLEIQPSLNRNDPNNIFMPRQASSSLCF